MVSYRLKYIAKQVNLDEPVAVKFYISIIKGSNSYKETFVKAYDYYVHYNGLSWNKPYYKWEQKIPKIPTTEQLTKIISCSSKKYSVIFKILMDTGVTPHELSTLSIKDIDLESGILNFQGCKGHSSRSFKLKADTHAMLKYYLSKFSKFPESYWMGRMWRQSRKLASIKLQDKSLTTIRCYDLRHYYACMLYHRTKDILLVKERMGHKKIETTMFYTRLIDFGNDEYTCKVAKSIDDATTLIESGFEYVTEMDGVKIFKKRK
jgi:integrase